MMTFFSWIRDGCRDTESLTAYMLQSDAKMINILTLKDHSFTANTIQS